MPHSAKFDWVGNSPLILILSNVFPFPGRSFVVFSFVAVVSATSSEEVDDNDDVVEGEPPAALRAAFFAFFLAFFIFFLIFSAFLF